MESSEGSYSSSSSHSYVPVAVQSHRHFARADLPGDRLNSLVGRPKAP
jgi:hypothetical protein